MATAAHVKVTQAGTELAATIVDHLQVTQCGLEVLGGANSTGVKVTQCGIEIVLPQSSLHTKLTQCGMEIVYNPDLFPPPQDDYVCPIDAAMTVVTIP